MKQKVKENTDSLLNDLAKGADEVYRARQNGMRTYSRVHGRLKPDMEPVYDKRTYPLIEQVSGGAEVFKR